MRIVTALSVTALACLTGCKLKHKKPQQTTSVSSRADEELAFPLADTLTKSFFQTHTQGIDAAQFEERWKASLENPLLFFRSYVRPYYAYVKDVPFPGRVAVCYGDSHPDNFGFVQFANQLLYTYNDLDDTGLCPAAFDVLRYFTALRLLEKDKDLFDNVLKKFFASLALPDEAPSLPSDYVPNLEDLRKKVLKKWSASGSLDTSKGAFAPIPAQQRMQLNSAFAAQPDLQALKILDAAEAFEHGGGSRGLTRYWVLVGSANKNGEPHDLIELKEGLREPATTVGGWGAPPADRLNWAINQIWKRSPTLYRTLSLYGKQFVVRSRVKDSINLEELKKDKREKVYMAQVGLLARQHAADFPDVNALRTWLEPASMSLEKRFQAAYDAAVKK